MEKRFVTIWFRNLKTDWLTRRHPHFADEPVVLTLPDHGRMMITATNPVAEKLGVQKGMALADARSVFPGLQIINDKPGWNEQLLNAFAHYCIRFTPVAAIDLPDGLTLEVTGCAHLLGGENEYVKTIISRFESFGYNVKACLADTIGTAWAVTKFGKGDLVVEKGRNSEVLLSLPATALRLETSSLELLYKLGLRKIADFISMPRTALRRRFGNNFLQRLDQALGYEEEFIDPVIEPPAYQERLPAFEFILSVTGIEIALQKLLDQMSDRLQKEQKGIRKASF